MEKKEFISCPECGSCVSVINGIISRHERGLGYVPYRLYHHIERFGTSVREQARKNLCCASGKSELTSNQVSKSIKPKEFKNG